MGKARGRKTASVLPGAGGKKMKPTREKEFKFTMRGGGTMEITTGEEVSDPVAYALKYFPEYRNRGLRLSRA